jgi:transketolase
MRELGWINDSHITNYFKDGSELKGLSDSRIRGLEVTSGSLGHGFSVGVGLAFGLMRKETDQKVYVIVGDGEINEGPVWEGALFASHHGLGNLMVIVDQNGFQAMGSTDEVISLGDIAAKFDAFGFDVLSIDGHDEEAIDTGIRNLWQTPSSRPKALIAKTVKGKGVSFMEANNRWHYTRLNPDTYAQATGELDQARHLS